MSRLDEIRNKDTQKRWNRAQNPLWWMWKAITSPRKTLFQLVRDELYLVKLIDKENTYVVSESELDVNIVSMFRQGYNISFIAKQHTSTEWYVCHVIRETLKAKSWTDDN